MLGMLAASLKPAPMQLSLLRQGDLPGIVTMAIGLGGLQTVLEEGNKDDWFGSPFIVKLSVIAAVALVSFLAIELTVQRPLLNLRLLLRRNFGFGTLANFLLGSALYGSVFILPLYLSQTQGYNAEQVGEVLAWTGLPQLLLIPLVPKLMRKVDARLLVLIGFALFATSSLMSTHLDADFSGPQFVLPNIVRAVGQALIMTPLSVLATAGIERENAGSASALFNMSRNLGGAIGIAILETTYTWREQYHSNILSSAVSLGSNATQQTIATLSAYFLSHGTSDPATARHEAIVAIGRFVRQQASLMGYGDTFFLLGGALLLALAATLFLHKAGRAAPGGAH
jgi:DHA2 family multidrug resistance protein